jgi:hypothetical protein
VLEPAGRRRWLESGKPIVPSLVLEGAVLPLLHVSQLAAALGIDAGGGAASPAVAWDIATIAGAWVAHVVELDWPTLTAPTASRGRSLRNLTVNTFHPVGLLPLAWDTGRFEWDPEGDGEREARLRDAEELRAYAEGIAARWNGFLLDRADALGRGDPPIRSPRGDLPYSALLDSQRWHAAFHYRQLVAHLAAHALPPVGGLDVERLVQLPPEVF